MSTNLVQHLTALTDEFPGIENVRADVINLMACRYFTQFCSTLRSLIDPKEYCPFCLKERVREKRKPLIVAGGWMLIENKFPHAGTERMLLIIPERHVTSSCDMSLDDWNRMGALFEHAQLNFGVPSGILFLRFGHPRYNSSSIAHLHFNVARPIPGSGFSPPASRTTEEYGRMYLRMRGFYREMMQRGGIDWLFSPQGVAET